MLLWFSTQKQTLQGSAIQSAHQPFQGDLAAQQVGAKTEANRRRANLSEGDLWRIGLSKFEDGVAFRSGFHRSAKNSAVSVCVPLVVTGILLNCLRLFQQGDHPCAVSDGPTKRPQYMRISGLIRQTYLQFYLRIPSWALLVT